MYFWWYPEDYTGSPYEAPRRDTAAASPDSLAVQEPSQPGDDRRLARSVAMALLHEPDVGGGSIMVQAQNGVVILEGDVRAESGRAAAVRRAWAVPGVADVCNILAVTGRRRRARWF